MATSDRTLESIARSLEGIGVCADALERVTKRLTKLLAMRERPALGEDDAPLEALAEQLRRLDRTLNDLKTCHLRFGAPLSAEEAGSRSAEILMGMLKSSAPPPRYRLGQPVLYGLCPPMAVQTVLGMLSMLDMTGVMRILADGHVVTLSIVAGSVVHGTSEPRPAEELLGHLLVERKVLEPEALERFLAEHGGSPARVGEALEREELVSAEELRNALELQMQLLFRRLFASDVAAFTFFDGECEPGGLDMKMNVTRLILESARIHDESQRSQEADPLESVPFSGPA